MTGAPQSAGTPPAAKAPPGRRIYAVGDIHGRADLLAALMERIQADGGGRPRVEQVIVFLGDYVDRGGASFNVVEELIGGPPRGFEAVYLKGNHEELLLEFLNDASTLEMWMMNGGAKTLKSYGIGLSKSVEYLGFSANEEAVQRDFHTALPKAHLDFFQTLGLHHTEGDYLFVHAGLRPGVPLKDQKKADLMWIRGEFLFSEADFGKIVVHGHSVTPKPEIRANRIGIDTGACHTGVLTCLVLDGAERRFLHT